jgi:DNA-binding transcriptional MerR regulator
MSNLMQIGELAKQTGLSLRTLRYYDEIGLLVPSHRTEADYRLYSEDDIMRLQQILSLRQLGFSLQEIRDCLENPEYSLPRVIDLHLARLQEQMAMSRSLLSKLSAIAQDLQTTQSVAVENLMQAMETLSMTQPYLTQAQHDLLEARLHQGQAEWQQLLAQVQAEMAKGSDLNSPEVQQMAWRWRSSILAFVGGDQQLYEVLTQLYQREGAEAASWGTLDTATLEYILKAVAFLSLREELVAFSVEKMAPEARAVLAQGQAAMRALRLNFYGTEGLLLGLLAVPTTAAAQALQAHGVDFAIAETLFRDWLGHCTVPASDIPAKIPFTPRAYRVLELTAEHAKQLGHEPIAAHHILLGLLQEGETGGGMAMRVLRECQIDSQRLQQQLSAL